MNSDLRIIKSIKKINDEDVNSNVFKIEGYYD